VPVKRKKTSWDKLFVVAAGQAGLFTAKQAGAAGLYRQLLRRYVEHGRVRRVRRGIYRIVHYPAAEHEELAELWLWSEREGVFSHETALALHDLSDVHPRRVHLTVPAAWRRRRLRVPRGLFLHYAGVPRPDRGRARACDESGANAARLRRRPRCTRPRRPGDRAGWRPRARPV
jgi:hypothetical protein